MDSGRRVHNFRAVVKLTRMMYGNKYTFLPFFRVQVEKAAAGEGIIPCAGDPVISS